MQQTKTTKKTSTKFYTFWHTHNIPCSNITGCNDRFSGSSENASQIVTFVTTGLHIVGELNHDDICKGIAITLSTTIGIALRSANA